MDNGLVRQNWQHKDLYKGVLILVVVEDGLVLMKKKIFVALFAGLNPCCNGRGSRTANAFTVSTSVSLVLILVVVDEGLVLKRSNFFC